MVHTLRRSVLFGVVFAGAGGCADETAAPTFAVADSAGVEVVTTVTAAWARTGSPWTLVLETEIGQLEGDEPYLFGDPVTPLRLDDGRIVVADRQAAEVRFFDAAGVFLDRMGGHGEGPGEFGDIEWVARCGEALLVGDRRLRRLTPVSFQGEARETYPMVTPEEGRPPYRSRCLPDGSVVAVGWGEFSLPPEGQDYHFFAQEAEAWRLLLPGDSVVTLGTYISSERLSHINRATGGGGSGPHPFSRSVVFGGTDEHLYVGSAERLQVEVRTLDGGLQRIFRGPDEDLIVDEAFLQEYLGADLAPPDSAQRARLRAADMPMPERYPAYTELLVDPLGHVWLERFTPPWESGRRWGVFDPSGAFLGNLDVPSDFTITDVGRDRVTGVTVDDLGVGRVRVYRLER